MRKAMTIAGITFLQGFRAQTFRIVALLFIALLGLAYFLRVLSLGNVPMMLRSFGLSGMEISGLLLIILGCVASFYRERETRLQAIHLTYVSFFDHALGRLLGNCLLIGAYIGLGTIACAIILWHEDAWSWSFIAGSYSIFLKLSIVCAFCSLFSNLLSSSVFASLSTVFVYLASEFASYPLAMMRKIPSGVPVSISRAIYHLLPNFDKIDLKHVAIYGESVTALFLLEITLYTLIYITMIFIPAWRVFARHEH